MSNIISDIGINSLEFDDKKLLLSPENGLFQISFITPQRKRLKLSSLDFNGFKSEGTDYIFEDKAVFDGKITVFVKDLDGNKKAFRIKVDNNTENIIEYINFPTVSVECNMKSNGGEDTLFWPSMEGVIIDNTSNKNSKFIEDTLGAGYCGITPGAATMQYMAFFSPNGCFYYGAHDKDCNLKDFEYRFISENKVEFICQLYPGGCKSYEMPYDMIIASFDGDWQDAAEIYREWLENSGMDLPKKLFERDDLPAWMEDSPVTFLYSVRGAADTDRDEKMCPNEYYPYTNILPLLDYYSEKMDCKLLPLLMHWEGSAPWATPYIWPPFGDFENFKQMRDSIHERGHVLGLYASGLGITTQSVTLSSYDITEEYENGGWKECTARDINDEPIFTDLAFVRSGYDVCPSCEKVKDVMVKEMLKVAEADIDYFQAFDQNLGGLPRLCWSENHNHPAAPGKWISDEMSDLFDRMNKAIKNAGKNMAMGCELAASETAMKHLPLNDARWFTGFRQGIPVPAYSYLYHEYINNFMGNQNGVQNMLNYDAAPENLLYRTAYSFLAGDMLTIMLGLNGKISWGWCADPYGSYPDSEPIIEFIKNANKWRTGFTKKYLRYGKMLKCGPADSAKNAAAVYADGRELIENTVLTRKYQAQDGTTAQFYVNRTTSPQKLKITGFGEKARLYTSPEESCDMIESITLNGGQIICVIE